MKKSGDAFADRIITPVQVFSETSPTVSVDTAVCASNSLINKMSMNGKGNKKNSAILCTSADPLQHFGNF